MKRFFPALFLLASCTAITPWQVDTISAGDALYNSARLTYRGPESASPLRLELIHSGGDIFAFLSLTQFTFHPSSPRKKTVQATFDLGDKSVEAELPLMEGMMRTRLSSPLTESLVATLLQKRAVRVSIDGFEETFLPENFSQIYTEWLEGSELLNNPLKGSAE